MSRCALTSEDAAMTTTERLDRLELLVWELADVTVGLSGPVGEEYSDRVQKLRDRMAEMAAELGWED
jgi:hypothetical protein